MLLLWRNRSVPLRGLGGGWEGGEVVDPATGGLTALVAVVEEVAGEVGERKSPPFNMARDS